MIPRLVRCRAEIEVFVRAKIKNQTLWPDYAIQCLRMFANIFLSLNFTNHVNIFDLFETFLYQTQ